MKLFKIKKNNEDENKVIEPFLEESSIILKLLIIVGVLFFLFLIWYIFLRKKKINIKKMIPKTSIKMPKKSSYNEVVENYPTERSNSIYRTSVFVNPMNPF